MCQLQVYFLNRNHIFDGCTVKRSKVFGPRHPVQGNWTQGTLHQGNWTQDILDPRKLDPRNVNITEIGPKIFGPNGKWTQDILVQGKLTQDTFYPKTRKFDPKKVDPKEIWTNNIRPKKKMVQQKFDPKILDPMINYPKTFGSKVNWPMT